MSHPREWEWVGYHEILGSRAFLEQIQPGEVSRRQIEVVQVAEKAAASQLK